MTAQHHLPSLAVLIDADNAMAQKADDLFRQIGNLGRASIRRIYGDFTGTRLQKWTAVLVEHAIVPLQQCANSAGKNATDIALVVDAMDLLHSGRVEGFCIVSSDSDFTRLALRIREHGLPVYGYGNATAPQSFQKACVFHDIELLEGQDNDAEPRHVTNLAVKLLRDAYRKLSRDGGPVHKGQLGQELRELDGDFSYKKYGVSSLSRLLDLCPEFRPDSLDHYIRRHAS
jgi:hypothetical protein